MSSLVFKDLFVQAGFLDTLTSIVKVPNKISIVVRAKFLNGGGAQNPPPPGRSQTTRRKVHTKIVQLLVLVKGSERSELLKGRFWLFEVTIIHHMYAHCTITLHNAHALLLMLGVYCCHVAD